DALPISGENPALPCNRVRHTLPRVGSPKARGQGHPLSWSARGASPRDDTHTPRVGPGASPAPWARLEGPLVIGIPRRLSALVLSGVGIAGLLAPAAVAADPRHSGAATTSAPWLAGEVVDGALPGPVGDMPDWRITTDGLVAVEAPGTDPEAAERVATTVADNVRSYNSHDDWGGDREARIGGATAKLLYAAVISESDPTDFGGHDMRAETLEVVRGPENGAEEGRISDRATG